jgi:glyoxylase I family protein
MNVDHFCLQLEHIEEEAIQAQLSFHCIEVREFAERYGAQGNAQSIRVYDPEGNTVELSSKIIA